MFCTGRTAGGAYAGATAGNGIGASAALGGGLDGDDGHGGTVAEAHAGGVSKKVVQVAQNGIPPRVVSFVDFLLSFKKKFYIKNVVRFSLFKRTSQFRRNWIHGHHLSRTKSR